MAAAYSTISFFLFLCLAIFIRCSADASCSVPALFILGDSTADVGTNTFLNGSLFRADFPYYGIDFPNSRPTGRFSNGFNSADFLAKLMGFKRSPPPFLFLVTHRSGLQKHAHKGVNFASAGSGLLDITGQMTNVVSMSEQIKQFTAVYGSLTSGIGPEATKKMLSKSIFCISVGSNDIFGYFFTNSTVQKEAFISLLVKAYESHIKSLYSFGARKFGIISVAPIGCCPSQRLHNPTGGCFEAMNDFAKSFHSSLNTLLCDLSSELKGMKYSLGNAYEMTINVIDDPYPFNITNVNTACCGFGTLNAEFLCNSTANLCLNRKEYLFWDAFHPTQAAARLAAETLYGGPTRFVSPINFSQLVEEN